MNDFDLWLERLGVNALRHEKQMLHINREKTAADFIRRLNKVLVESYEVDIMCTIGAPNRREEEHGFDVYECGGEVVSNNSGHCVKLPPEGQLARQKVESWYARVNSRI